MAAKALAYTDTIDLLQYKIITYIRLNSALNSNIAYKTRFVDVTEHAINFNFYEFNEAYQEKFIEADFEAYSTKFIEFIKPVFQDFIKEIHYGGYTFRVSIKFNAERFEKVFSVLSPGNPSKPIKVQ